MNTNVRRPLFGLIDMNSFYVSAETVFNPRLRNKPVCVTSNGDGCVVARNAAAKALGIAMSQPAFELRELVAKQGLILLSSNYALYGDVSARVQSIIREFVPHHEVYSIDESFMQLQDVREPRVLCEAMRERVLQWVGIPCCVGIGPSKGLAKLANRRAKKRGPAVVDLSDPTVREEALHEATVEDVWGIASRWGARLRDLGITTALQLRDAPAPLLRRRFGVVMERIQRELQGYSCLPLAEAEPDRKQIFCSRSFGTPVHAMEPLSAAVANHVTRAAERMRERGLRAAALQVFFHTSPFRDGPQYAASRTMPFAVPCDDTRVMLRAARAMVEASWRDGYCLVKCGVGLFELTRGDHQQQPDLFTDQDANAGALMSTVDRINRKFGRGALRYGVQALAPGSSWEMRQASLSPRYTTRWKDVLHADTVVRST